MPVLREATTAVFYTVFAGLFVWVNLAAQGVEVSSAIYEAVVLKYDQFPWSYTTSLSKHMKDVNSATDLYTWLSVVFTTVTFYEQPKNGESHGYCTDRQTCGVGEGPCDQDNQCSDSNTCGDRTAGVQSVKANGDYVSIEDLLEYCNWAGTPVDINVVNQDCSVEGNPAGKPACCYSPHIGDYVTTIEPWNQDEPVVSANCPIFLGGGSGSCCASTDPAMTIFNETELNQQYQDRSQEEFLAPAHVGAFNQVLMIRLSLKRFKMRRSTNVFPTAVYEDGQYKKGLSAATTSLSADYNNGRLEDKETYTSTTTNNTYTYEHGRGYNDAGAYVVWVDPLKGEDAMRRQLSALKVDGWFDYRLATFTADMMVFNGNVDKYVHVAFTFSLDGVGQNLASTRVKAFNLNLYNFNFLKYQLRFAIEQLLLFFVLCFILLELRKLLEVGFFGHFRNIGALIDLISLSLCLMVLLSNYVLQADNLMSHSGILENFRDPSMWETTFRDMETIAVMVDDQNYIVAVNLFVVFVRMVALLAQLQSNLGLILKVLDKAFYNMAYFLGTFMMIMLGFVFFAFFTFGTRFMAMSSPTLAFYQVFGMLIGVPVYQDLIKADEVMAPVFFYTFYVLFYLVMKNMFVSILMTGYDFADHDLQTNKGSVKEQNPFITIKNDLKTDIGGPFLRVLTKTKGALGFCLSPLVEVTIDCMGSCLPSKNPLTAVKEMLPRRLRGGNDGGSATQTKAKPKKKKSEEDKPNMVRADCGVNFFFLAVFMLFVYFQTRGLTSYHLADATYKTVRDQIWVASNPMRRTSFQELGSFEEVFEWAIETIVGRPNPGYVFQRGLYMHPKCAVVNGEEVAPEDCDNSKENQQLVNQVNSWNVAFLNTTFVRVTIQTHCFIANDDDKVSTSYPFVTVLPNAECATQDCSSIRKEQERKSEPCKDYLGQIHEAERYGLQVHMPDQLGPYRLHGGYAISLGVTASQALTQLEMMEKRNLFTKDTASMVFDFITYNGNSDMFVYSSIFFNLLPTGRFVVASEGVAFPMNIFFNGGGGWDAPYRSINIALFMVYALLVIGFLAKMGLDMYKELKNTRDQGKPAYLFLRNYYSNFWNVSDTLSMMLSVTAIVYLLVYVLLPFRKNFQFSVSSVDKYHIPNPDVERFGMVGTTDSARYLQEDWYIFHAFEQCVEIYSVFLFIAGVNSFFISIKVVKFVGQVEQVQVFSNTLNEGKERIFYFTVIILLLLFGFALFYTILFGTSVPGMSSPMSSVTVLFDWMVGKVTLEPLMKVSENLAISSYVCFMMFFYFIAVNMYLATMMNTYSITVGEMDVKRKKKEVESTRKIRVVEYDTLDALKADFTFEREREHPDAHKPRFYETCAEALLPELTITKLTAGGKADGFAVQKGHLLWKVNGDRVEFRRHATIDDILEKGIQMDHKNGRIRITFKDPATTESVFGKVKGRIKMGIEEKDEKQDGVQATVKNFWRTQGAVTFVYQQIANKERADEVEKKEIPDGDGGRNEINGEEGEDGDENDDDGGDEDRGEGGDGEKGAGGASKSARTKAKKRLENLLFSRWPLGSNKVSTRAQVIERGRLDGPDPPFEGPPGPSQVNEKDLDFDSLRDKVEEMMVTGEEAWLDCLVTAIEKELDEESSIVTDVLRTSEMSESGNKKDAKTEGKKSWETFHTNANKVLQILEYKARRKYYMSLQMESETRQMQFNRQNIVLHEYVWELEREFSKIMGEIHYSKTKKQSMLRQLAGLLDKSEYKNIAGEAQEGSKQQGDNARQHMERLTTPWPVARSVPDNAKRLSIQSSSNPPAITR